MSLFENKITKRLKEAQNYNEGDSVRVNGVNKTGKIMFIKNGMISVKFSDGSEGEFDEKQVNPQ